MKSVTDRVLVVGGGIAGPVVAMALQRIGMACTVFEASADATGRPGSFLTIASNGLDALRAIDAHEVVGDVGIETPRMTLRNHAGRTLGTVEMGASLDGLPATTTLMRSELHAALMTEMRRRGIPIVQGARLTRFQETTGGVAAHFADGTSQVGCLLVGADGVWSATRRCMYGDEPQPVYAGLVGTGGVARGLGLDLEPGTFHFTFGRRAFFGHCARSPDEIWWFANVPMRNEPSRTELAAISRAEWRRSIAELFADDRSPASQIIASTDERYFTLNPVHTREPPRAGWFTGRTVLIGDAAHTTSPSSGQGASLAIEDAIELARCLRDCDGLPEAFRAYQQRRADRVRRILRAARRANQAKAAGPIGRVLRDAILPYALKIFADPRRQAWIYAHRIDFHRQIDGATTSAREGT